MTSSSRGQNLLFGTARPFPFTRVIAFVTAGHFSPKLLLRENGLEVAPEDGEDNGLHAVGIQLRLETAEKEALHALLLDDRPTSTG